MKLQCQTAGKPTKSQKGMKDALFLVPYSSNPLHCTGAEVRYVCTILQNHKFTNGKDANRNKFARIPPSPNDNCLFL